MKVASFVPVIGPITPDAVDGVPGLAEAVSFWTQGRPAAEWFREMEECWGTAGFVVRRGDEVQGFVVYGPPERFPFAIARVDGSEMASSVMTVPQKTRYCGHHAYVGTAYSFKWIFVTARNAYQLPKYLPFVGYLPHLGVAIIRTTEEEFVGEMREKLPWLLERKSAS